jgi:RNA polymerase sigma-70 factor (ECF subfamily)
LNQTITDERARVRRILKGDQAAFRELFDAYFPKLYRFALARLDGDHDAAAEVVQQTFCRAIEKLASWRGEAALYTWFCQICRNAIIDVCRARQRSARNVRLIEDEPQVRAVLEALAAPAADRPEFAAWRRDIARLVEATVDALPDHYAAVLEWKYVDGLPVAEIATRLGIGSKAAESLLTRARLAFREAITAMAATADALQPPGTT